MQELRAQIQVNPIIMIIITILMIIIMINIDCHNDYHDNCWSTRLNLTQLNSSCLPFIIWGPTEVSGHSEEARGAGRQEWAWARSRHCRRHGRPQGGDGGDEDREDNDDGSDKLISEKPGQVQKRQTWCRTRWHRYRGAWLGEEQKSIRFNRKMN